MIAIKTKIDKQVIKEGKLMYKKIDNSRIKLLKSYINQSFYFIQRPKAMTQLTGYMY